MNAPIGPVTNSARPEIGEARNHDQGPDQRPHLVVVEALEAEAELIAKTAGPHDSQDCGRPNRALEAIEGVGHQIEACRRHDGGHQGGSAGRPLGSEQAMARPLDAVEGVGVDPRRHQPERHPDGDDGDHRVQPEDLHQRQRPHDLVSGAGECCHKTHSSPCRSSERRRGNAIEVPTDPSQDRPDGESDSDRERRAENGESNRVSGRLRSEYEEVRVQSRIEGGGPEAAEGVPATRVGHRTEPSPQRGSHDNRRDGQRRDSGGRQGRTRSSRWRAQHASVTRADRGHRAARAPRRSPRRRTRPARPASQ